MKIKICSLWLIFIFCNIDNNIAQQAYDSIDYSIDIENVVITGQFSPTHYKKAVHHINTLAGQKLEKLAYNSLEDIIKLLPNTKLNYDPILGTTISLRGVSQDNVAILLDGIPMIGRLDGGIDISQINIVQIERIEIIEGPLSNLYGNNAAGGVINIIRKKPKQNGILFSNDSYNESVGILNQNNQLSISNELITLGLSYNFYKNQLYPIDSTRLFETIEISPDLTEKRKRYPWNPKTASNYGLDFRWFLGDNTFIDFNSLFFQEEVQNLGEKRRMQFMPYAFDNRYETERHDNSIQFQSDLSNSLFMKAQLAINNFTRKVNYERYEFDSESINQELSRIDTSLISSFFMKSLLSTTNSTGPNYIIGINSNHESIKAPRIVNIETGTNRVSNSELALFGGIKSDLNGFQSELTSRWNYNKNYGNNLTSAINSNFHFSENSSLRFGVAQGYRAPTIKELYLNFIDVNHFVIGNSSLLPEKSIDLNINYSNNLFGHGDFSIDYRLKSYYNQISDKILLVERENLQFQYLNIAKSQSLGVDVRLLMTKSKLTIDHQFSYSLWGNSIAARASILSNTPVVDFTNVISYSFNDFELSTVIRYVGETPRFQLSNEHVIKNTTESYTLMDIMVNKSFVNDHISFSAGIKNVFNVSRLDVSGQTLNTGIHETSKPSQLINYGRSFVLKAKFNMFLKY